MEDTRNKNLDELDLSPFLNKIYSNIGFIFVSTTILSLIIFSLSFLIPNKFSSYATLQPVEDQSINMPSQLGGLASFAGLNLQDSSNKTDLALKILTSLDFFESMYYEEDFLVDLMAAKKFNPASKIYSLDNSLYDTKSKAWVRNKKEKKPTIQESYEVFIESLSFFKDKNSQFFQISFKHISPYKAQKWLNVIIQKLNKHIKDMETDRAKSSLDYLMVEISKTDITEIKEVISSLIQKELSILTISAGSENYVFNIIDSPRVAEKKSEPSRIQILFIGFLLSLLMSISFIFFKDRK